MQFDFDKFPFFWTGFIGWNYTSTVFWGAGDTDCGFGHIFRTIPAEQILAATCPLSTLHLQLYINVYTFLTLNPHLTPSAKNGGCIVPLVQAGSCYKVVRVHILQPCV